MNNLPHRYAAAATASPDGEVSVKADGVPRIMSVPPREFGGPGDRWSPETLLVAAVADCFILTFRAVAEASKLPWISLTCLAKGTLDRVDRVNQFTDFAVHADLRVPADVDPATAARALAKARQVCLLTNSLKATTHLEIRIEVAEATPGSAQAVA